MFYGIWQLAKFTLTTDSRRASLHALRFGLVVTLYFAVCYARWVSWSSTPGLQIFQMQLLITAFFLSMTSIFGFSQTITEEKEEGTLGLMRLADINPLAIVLGKLTGTLCDAALLIAIEFPFTIIAITLGGLSWPQVIAAYVALATYLWLLAALGVLVSVLQPTGGAAARLTAMIVAVYTVPPILPTNSSLFAGRLQSIYRPMSLPIRLVEVSESTFTESPWCWPVAFGFIVGCLFLLIAWAALDRVSLIESSSGSSRRFVFGRRTSRRAWSRPLIWREYIYMTGGVPWTIARIGIQFAIVAAMFLLMPINFPRGRYVGFAMAWSAICSGLFGLLDGTWTASRLFRDEIRYRTWSSLVQTPHSLKELARDKYYGWALGLAPTIVSPFIFIVAMILLHEHIPRRFITYAELIIGTITFGVSVFGYLHLLMLLSLYFGWKATPMTLTICFALGWLTTIMTFTHVRTDEGRCLLFAALSLLICGLMWTFHKLILRRLKVLAEIA